MCRRDSGLALSNLSVSLAPDTMQIEPPTEALRLLAGCTSTSTDANDIFETLHYNLKDITIEMPDHERADYLVQQIGPSKLEQMSLFIRYFVYLSSNNLLDNERMDKLVEWMVGSKTQWVLDPLLDLRTPTTEIFASNIFVSAARLGESDVVRSLIARGIDVDASAGTSFRQTALEKAVQCQHPGVVELLLNAGADPKTQISSEHSLLFAAFGGPHRLKMLKMLFNKGADVNAVGDDDDNHNGPLLLNAVEACDHEITRFLLEAGADIDAFDPYRRTALQVAVADEDVEAVQILIAAGADIDGPAGDLAFEAAEIREIYAVLRTPIQQASLTGNTEIVQILVSEGANVNAFLREGYNKPDPWEQYRRYQWNRYAEFEDTQFYEDIMMTPLQAAVSRRDPALVQILLAAGADVDAEGCGDTPSQMAAALGEAELVEILVKYGADVNAPAADEGGKTALQAAARADNYELVQYLLDSGSETNAAASPSGGRTALQAAAEIGNVDLAKFLIEVGADVNADASPESGRTCLQAAVEHGHVEMVLMLLNEGADVNGSAATISGGLTALQAALLSLNYNDEEPDVWRKEQSQDTILQALFDAGADINAPSSPQGGMTTIVAAVKTGKPDLVRWCLQEGADPNISADRTSALGAAVLQGSDELVTLLIEGGADVNVHCEMYVSRRTPIGLTLWTPLHIAARTGSIKIANLLWEAGAEINLPLPQPDWPTVLQSAIAGNSITMVQFLLNNGADLQKWGWGLTPPTAWKRWTHTSISIKILNALAVAGGDFSRIMYLYGLNVAKKEMQKLLDSGALMHWQAEQKGHLLQAAIERGYTDLIQEMLDAGADVNVPAPYFWGRTALQRAAERGYTDIITSLLSYGANVNAPAGYYKGITALQGAALNGNLKIVLILLKAGAEINAAPAIKEGRTALEAAAEHGHLDIVSLLLENDHDTEGMELRCERAARLAEREGHKVIARILREHKTGQGTTE